SAGTHLSYLMRILKDDYRFDLKDLSLMSINSDPVAVEKIISKGISAKLCSAEEFIHGEHQHADILMSFEMLEHLYDPISFLDTLSKRGVSELFVLTVPYLSQSRIGLHHIRRGQQGDTTPETTHIFELSPGDWKLIFMHSGWKILIEEIYYQYPRRSLLRALQPCWKRLDFEGFYGAVLERDRSWADLSDEGVACEDTSHTLPERQDIGHPSSAQ
ncbi:MAG: hypothetical protein HQ517_17375, partial [SAR324 cluster bacterium]|nr:hypothetical protein [SAR324 cluster bacterium]